MTLPRSRKADETPEGTDIRAKPFTSGETGNQAPICTRFWGRVFPDAGFMQEWQYQNGRPFITEFQ